jgi:hypothetical protein
LFVSIFSESVDPFDQSPKFPFILELVCEIDKPLALLCLLVEDCTKKEERSGMPEESKTHEMGISVPS